MTKYIKFEQSYTIEVSLCICDLNHSTKEWFYLVAEKVNNKYGNMALANNYTEIIKAVGIISQNRPVEKELHDNKEYEVEVD